MRFPAEVAETDNEPTQLSVVWDSNIQGELTVDSPNSDGMIDTMVALADI